MESVYLKTFIEVAKTRNLTKAASNLHITPSAASRRIKFMEDQYGYSLLDRSGPLLMPTEAGALVLEKAQQLIRIEKELLSGLTNIRKTPKFSFGCTPAFGIAHLPEVMRGFMLVNAELNNLELNFDIPDNLIQGLKDHLYSLAVIEHCTCLDFSGFTTIPLPADEMIFVSSPLLFAGVNDITIDTMVSQPLYTRKESCCSSKFLKFNMERIGRDASEFKKMVVYDDLHIIIDSVVKGDGIAYLSKSLVSNQLTAGTLAGHHAEGFIDRKNRTFVMSDTAQQEEIIIKFVKEILKYFGLPCDLSTELDVTA